MTNHLSESVGIIVPPSNPTLEVEIKSLLGDNPYLYTSRLPIFPNCDLAQRNTGYLANYLDTARRFGSLPLTATIVGLTGSNYADGPDADRARCDAISEELNAPFTTCSLAILDLLQSLGFSRLHLELPYPDWLIRKAKMYWERAGIEVVAANSILDALGASDAYMIDSRQLDHYLSTLTLHSGAPILLSGTGMRTTGALEDLVDRVHAPLLSSNLAAAHWLLKQCQDDRCNGSVLFKKLIEKLKRFSTSSDWNQVDAFFNPY